jgi:hypothetical protein
MNQILEFVEKHNPAFHEIIFQLDIENDLIVDQEGEFTFLMPNAETIAKLVKLADEDDDRALSLVMSLFLQGNYSSQYDWLNTDEILNILNRKVETSTIERNKIVFKNKCEITLNRNFRSQSASIYNIVGGDMPPIGKKIATKKKKKEEVKPVDKKVKVNIRQELFKSIMESSNQEEKCYEIVNSLLYFMRQEIPDIYESVLPFLDYSPIVSFFILIEPGKGQYYFVDEKILNAWFSAHNNPIQDYFISGFHSLVYNSELKDEIQEQRDIILSSSSAKEFIANIDEIYSNLITKNQIGSVNNVLTKRAHSYLISTCKHYNIKLMQDELRMIHDNLVSERHTSRQIMQQMYNRLRLLPFFDDPATLSAITKQEFIANASVFVNTTNFLYLAPSRASEFGGVAKSLEFASPNGDVIDTTFSKIRERQGRYDIVQHFNELRATKRVPKDLIHLVRNLSPDDE